MKDCSTGVMSSQYTFMEWYSFELGMRRKTGDGLEFECRGLAALVAQENAGRKPALRAQEGSCGLGAQHAAPLQMANRTDTIVRQVSDFEMERRALRAAARLGGLAEWTEFPQEQLRVLRDATRRRLGPGDEKWR